MPLNICKCISAKSERMELIKLKGEQMVFISMIFFKSSNLDLCLLLMCHCKLLLVMLWLAATPFAHKVAFKQSISKWD